MDWYNGLNTTDVINWFYNIKDKTTCSLIQFDIMDFYPFISRELFTLALDFTKYSDLSKEGLYIIMNARKSALIHNKIQWIKNNSGDQFDIAMGLLGSAESANLIGLFILYNLTAPP